MPRDLEHLALPAWNEQTPLRKLRGGKRKSEAIDSTIHGQDLIAQVGDMAERFEERRKQTPKDINPSYIFKLKIREGMQLEEDVVRRMGLHLLGMEINEQNEIFVVFPDQETLDRLRQRVNEYAGRVEGGHQYNELAAVEAVLDVTPADRTGPRLKAQPIGNDEVVLLDIELWHTGDMEVCRRQIREITTHLQGLQLQVTDTYRGTQLCLMRARLNPAALEDLLNIDYVKEVERRPEPTFDMLTMIIASAGDFAIEQELPEDLVGILILDSGIVTGHPMLGPAIGDAQSFLDASQQVAASPGPEDGDTLEGGHGTAVAGLAVYGDVWTCIRSRTFNASARLFSARLADDNNQYAEDKLLETQVRTAVEYFLTNYPSVRVINISFGNKDSVYSDRRHQFRFAAVLDELAYEYRERNIVFVVSTGNYMLEEMNDIDDEGISELYPAYLLDSKARLIDPATSAIAITVGGLSFGEGRPATPMNAESTAKLVAGEQDFPSPFTRTGWGVDGAIKPEVVDYAGDFRHDHGRLLFNPPQHAGIPTTARDFAPPEGRLFRTVAGTSFAAPRIANLAARLMREFPQASSNLIRALIADSARIPDFRPPMFARMEPWEDNLLRVYGYGRPEFERARWSEQRDVLLLADDVLPVEETNFFKLFTIPALPDGFLTIRGASGYRRNGYISVTLAYDPPTRHTRMADYLGIKMGFLLFRNASPEQIADALRVLTKEEKKALDEQGIKHPSLGRLREENELPPTVDLKPGVQRRDKGTLQRAQIRIAGPDWKYDGGPLILAVLCRREWAPIEITEQRFAVIARLNHDDHFINIYDHIRQHATVYQRIWVRTSAN